MIFFHKSDFPVFGEIFEFSLECFCIQTRCLGYGPDKSPWNSTSGKRRFFVVVLQKSFGNVARGASVESIELLRIENINVRHEVYVLTTLIVAVLDSRVSTTDAIHAQL